MAASSERKDKLSPVVTVDTITVTHLHRDSIATDWKDAEVVRVIEFDVNAVPDVLVNGNEQISPKAHGLNTVLQQRASDIKNTAEKLDYYVELWAQLEAGIWREAAQPRSAQISALAVQAVATLQGFTIPQAQAALQACSPDERKAILAADRVVAEIAKLKAEVQSVDKESLLDLLG